MKYYIAFAIVTNIGLYAWYRLSRRQRVTRAIRRLQEAA